MMLQVFSISESSATSTSTYLTNAGCPECKTVIDGPLNGMYGLKWVNHVLCPGDGCVYENFVTGQLFCFEQNGLYYVHSCPKENTTTTTTTTTTTLTSADELTIKKEALEAEKAEKQTALEELEALSTQSAKASAVTDGITSVISVIAAAEGGRLLQFLMRMKRDGEDYTCTEFSVLSAAFAALDFSTMDSTAIQAAVTTYGPLATATVGLCDAEDIAALITQKKKNLLKLRQQSNLLNKRRKLQKLQFRRKYQK